MWKVSLAVEVKPCFLERETFARQVEKFGRVGRICRCMRVWVCVLLCINVFQELNVRKWMSMMIRVTTNLCVIPLSKLVVLM